MVLLLAALFITAFATEGRLLRFPDVHGDKLVFVHGGDLWLAPAGGGTAMRLTSHIGIEQFPKFSPDGKWIAFTGQYDGDPQVYVIPVTGGEPKQLTYYPANIAAERFGSDNMVYGWTPDGKKVLFRSQRDFFDTFVGRLYTVDLEGGMPTALPMPTSGYATFSPDGKRLAYNRVMRDFRPWKRYKGGMAQDVHIYDLATNNIERLTDWEGTDNYPMWVGDRIYFNSDRGTDGRLNLYYIDLGSKQTTQVTDFSEFDVKFPSLGNGKIAFENGGYIYILDPATGKYGKVTIDLPDDRTLARPVWAAVAANIESYDLARGGARAIFTARGEIFTVPAEKGDTRNLTNTPGVREKYATWSPDGKLIAYLSDKDGEDNLYVRDLNGVETKLTELTDRYRFAPTWSPDSQKLLFFDSENELHFVDVASKKMTTIDRSPVGTINDAVWSPDSKWIAYSISRASTGLDKLFLYSLASGQKTGISDEYTDDSNPVFDPDGKYLYFVSARDIRPTYSQVEWNFAVTNMVRPYLLTLAADTPNPFAPESDEVAVEEAKPEKKDEPAGAKKDEAAKPSNDIRVDLAGIAGRVVGFPVQPGNVNGLGAVRGVVFYFKGGGFGPGGPGGGGLFAFDLKKREEVLKIENCRGYSIAPDMKKMIYRAGNDFGITAADANKMKPGDGRLNLSGLEMRKHPALEWLNVFNETWRRYRDYFYDYGMHGVDWKAIGDRYRTLVPHAAHRNDLTYIISEMVSELGVGHAYVGGGEQPSVEVPRLGLLGCTFQPTSDGFYKINKIYAGENWQESLRSPLTEPGIAVREGDYLIRIDGQLIKSGDNLYRYLVNKAKRTVEIAVNDKPTSDGARTYTVKPIESEWDLRYYNWVKKNRDYVAQKTNGQVAYLHIPDMGVPGLTEFIKWYYTQLDRKGLIVDIRYNGGGNVSAMILERLRRVMAGMGHSRTNAPTTYPGGTFAGPMVCITNLYAASDGDIFGHYFQAFKLGPVIGTRSWGGTVGITGGPLMIDGGNASIPLAGTYNLDSQWILENKGVVPDIELDNLPARELAGYDDQLDKAIEIVMEKMKTYGPWRAPKPSQYPRP